MKFVLVALAAFLALTFSSPALAAPAGVLNVNNCDAGGVSVNLTTIDWLLPVGGGFGCIITGSGTSVTYSGGTLGPNVQGTIKDLSLAATTVPSFMIFQTLNFDLTGIGPGVSNTTCATTLNPNLPSCSITLTLGGQTFQSPFILAPTSTGTSVTLSATGTVVDANGPSTWAGLYTTQFSGVTPAQIATAITTAGNLPGFCVAGTCTSTYSGTFNVTVSSVPEPVTLMTVGLGLIGLAFVSRRRQRS
jgi:hypothetical protein